MSESSNDKTFKRDILMIGNMKSVKERKKLIMLITKHFFKEIHNALKNNSIAFIGITSLMNTIRKSRFCLRQNSKKKMAN